MKGSRFARRLFLGTLPERTFTATLPVRGGHHYETGYNAQHPEMYGDVEGA